MMIVRVASACTAGASVSCRSASRPFSTSDSPPPLRLQRRAWPRARAGLPASPTCSARAASLDACCTPAGGGDLHSSFTISGLPESINALNTCYTVSGFERVASGGGGPPPTGYRIRHAYTGAGGSLDVFLYIQTNNGQSDSTDPWIDRWGITTPSATDDYDLPACYVDIAKPNGDDGITYTNLAKAPPSATATAWKCFQRTGATVAAVELTGPGQVTCGCA
jgi:hypothetical protein